MKKVLFVLGLLFATSAFAQSDRGEVSMLIALENAWNQAQLHHDSKALDSLVADTFITTDNDGVLMNKVAVPCRCQGHGLRADLDGEHRCQSDPV